MATAGEKIQHIRLSRKPRLTQSQLAKMLSKELTRDVIANYENNRTEPEQKHILKLARLWGIDDPDWFWDGGELEPPAPVASLPPGSAPPPPVPGVATPGSGRRRFHVLGVAGAAAFPIETEDPDDWVEFSDDLYHPDRYAIRLIGDSMEPRIPDDSFILIHPHKQPPVGLITVAKSQNHEYAVKVRRVREGRDVLVPINPAYDEIIPGEGWEVVGYVVGWRKERRRGKYAEEGDNDGLRP